MASIRNLALGLNLCLSLWTFALANPEQGKWTFDLDQEKQFAAVAKHMYNYSKITVAVSLSCEDDDAGDIEISWLLRLSPCALEYIAITEDINSNKNKEQIKLYMNNPVTYRNAPYDRMELFRENVVHSCSEKEFKLEGNPDRKLWNLTIPKISPEVNKDVSAQGSSNADTKASGTKTESGAQSSDNQQAAPAASAGSSPGEKASPGNPASAPSRRKRAEDPAQAPNQAGGAEAQNQNKTAAPSTDQKTSSSAASTTSVVPAVNPDKVDHQTLVRTWVGGNYLFAIQFKPKNENAKFKAEVTILTFYGDDNFISALDQPLLIFYGIMGLIYILYGIVWLLLLACNWRDLLRVQFWIGGVIFLGMLEKAVFFAEYENLNKTGHSGSAAIIFAELVSCAKRTLARMLVIIVSLGFGIVKPRLGQAFHKVLCVGGLFFLLSAIEGCMRATSSKVDQSNQFLLAAVPLAVLDAIICWWIFSSLIQTTRTLRLRRNLVKLSLYRHFTNALVFNVLASLAYMVWFMTQHKFKECVKDWKQLWVDEAFWHVLFVVLLFIIMILWRPTANNQRFAFSPLLDAADEEEEDSLMNDAFDGMKMRGVKNGSPKQRDSKSKMEDDLKWVEENIPSSVADKALPTMLDSDEELMTTRFEMSKME